MSYFVYIVECSDKTFYTGSTNNLEKRLAEHNTKRNAAHYTKIRRPVSLVYREVFQTFGEARAREAKIKRLSRAGKQELVQQNKS